MERVDAAVLEAIAGVALREQVVEAVVDQVTRNLADPGHPERVREGLRRELQETEERIERLVQAIAGGAAETQKRALLSG